MINESATHISMNLSLLTLLQYQSSFLICGQMSDISSQKSRQIIDFFEQFLINENYF